MNQKERTQIEAVIKELQAIVKVSAPKKAAPKKAVPYKTSGRLKVSTPKMPKVAGTMDPKARPKTGKRTLTTGG